MRIYTEVTFQWDDDQNKLVEISSESYDYEGELSLCASDEILPVETYYDSDGKKFTVHMKYGDARGLGDGVTDLEVKDETGTVVYKLDKDYTKGNKEGSIDARRQNALQYIKTGDGWTGGRSESFVKQRPAPRDVKKVYTADEYEEIKSLIEGTREPLVDFRDELNELRDPDKDDIYERALVDAASNLEFSLGEAQDAMTTFSEDLKSDWETYLSKDKSLRGKYQTGEEWTDTDGDGIVDVGEYTDTDGDGKWTPPGTEVMKAITKYQDDVTAAHGTYDAQEEVLATTRDNAFENLKTIYGDPFVDENDNSRWDEGEEFTDIDGDGSYTAGTQISSAEDNYMSAYQEVMGTTDIEEGDEGYLKGSYYTDMELADLKRKEGMEGHKLTRGESYTAFRGEAEGKISQAKAEVAGRKFDTSGAGFTAREQLALELSKNITDIEETFEENRGDVVTQHGVDVNLAEQDKARALGRAESDRKSTLTPYYTKSQIERGMAGAWDPAMLEEGGGTIGSDYRTSEGLLATARANAIKKATTTMKGDIADKTAELTDPVTGLAAQQRELKRDVDILKDPWERKSADLLGEMVKYGADPRIRKEYAGGGIFDITGASGRTVAKEAKREIGDIFGEMSDLSWRLGDMDNIGEDFDLFRSKMGLTDIFTEEELGDYGWKPGIGSFMGETEGLFQTDIDPVTGLEATKYQMPEGADWLYDPEKITMPWTQEVTEGDWAWDPTDWTETSDAGTTT